MLIHKLTWDLDKLAAFFEYYCLADFMSNAVKEKIIHIMRTTTPDHNSAWLIAQYISSTTSYFPPNEVTLRLIWNNLVSICFIENE